MAIQAKEFTGEIGIHYPLHVLNRYSLPELIGIAERAWQTLGKLGARVKTRGQGQACVLTYFLADSMDLCASCKGHFYDSTTLQCG
jgi:hypothetical protein